MNPYPYYENEDAEENSAFEWLTPKDVQAELGIGPNTFYRLVNSRQLPAYRIGKLWRVKRSELESWQPQ